MKPAIENSAASALAEPERRSTGVVIPSWNGAAQLARLLLCLKRSTLAPKIVVVDSCSTDGTADVARAFGATVLSVPRREFNHGLTRELGRRCLDTDISVMMTQDSQPTDDLMLARLIEPLILGRASISYGRQLARQGAGICEAYPRLFNYPEKSHVRSIADLAQYGAYTFFCSNSFAAYRNAALDEIGGFGPTVMGEDTIAVAKLLLAGHSIAYVAEATVWHSHALTAWSLFRRYFDVGYFRGLNREIFTEVSDRARGWSYARGFLHAALHSGVPDVPRVVVHLAAQYAGYRVGSLAHRMPSQLAARLSAQPAFWLSGQRCFDRR